MSPLKASALTAPVAALATLAALFFLNSSRAREAGMLRYENDRLRRTAYERMHPASVSVPLPPSAASPAVAVPAARPLANSAPLYRDEGRATPVATLQTYAWACDRGDAQTVKSLLYLDASSRTKAEAYFATLPPPARANWASVDDMAATLLTADIMEHPFPGADLLATATLDPIAADRVRVRLPGTPKDRIEFQKTAAGWSYVITEAAVDAYLARAPKITPPAQ